MVHTRLGLVGMIMIIMTIHLLGENSLARNYISAVLETGPKD